jgi:hypothetical protein
MEAAVPTMIDTTMKAQAFSPVGKGFSPGCKNAERPGQFR